MLAMMAFPRTCQKGGGEDGGGDDGDGTVFPEHPGPILHAPRDNISHKGVCLKIVSVISLHASPSCNNVR